MIKFQDQSIDAINSLGFIIGLVDVDLSKLQDPSKRINITIPANVQAGIDTTARSKSKFVPSFYGMRR